MSSKKFNPFKDFQSDQWQRSSCKIFTAHYICTNADLNLPLVTGMTNGIHFSNNQFVNRILVGMLHLPWLYERLDVCMHVWKHVSQQSLPSGIFCGANGDTFFWGGGGGECSPPSWVLKLTESWGKSKTEFKGEVGGFKIERGEGERRKNTLSFPPLPLFQPSSINFLFSFQSYYLWIFVRKTHLLLRLDTCSCHASQCHFLDSEEYIVRFVSPILCLNLAYYRHCFKFEMVYCL